MKTIKALIAVILFFVLLVAAYVAYYLYANHQAETAAMAFCAALAKDTPVADVAARASAARGRYLASSTSNTHRVFFQGAPFNGTYCELNVADGKVVSWQVTTAED